MNYSKLFDTLYSESISEDVKDLVVEKVLDEAVMRDVDFLEESIHESNSKVSAYQEALSYLVNSNISEEAMMETLDLMFANESEEVIGQVEEAFKEDVAKGILVEALLEDYEKSAGGIFVPRSSTPSKSSQEWAKKQNKEISKGLKRQERNEKLKVIGSKIATGAKTALGKLKDTVGKVFSKKEAKATDIGKGDGSFRSKEPKKVEMNKGDGSFRGKNKGAAPVGLAAIKRAHGEEPVQKSESKPLEQEVKNAANARKENMERGSVRTGRSTSDDAFDVSKQNKENKNMAKEAPKNEAPDKPQGNTQLNIPGVTQSGRTAGVDKQVKALEAKIAKYKEMGEENLKPNQKKAYSNAQARLRELQSTNESMIAFTSLLDLSEGLIKVILEMTKPSKETYEKLGKKHKEAFDQAVTKITPRVIGDRVIEPSPEAIKQAEEVGKKYEQVQTRAKKEVNIDV